MKTNLEIFDSVLAIRKDYAKKLKTTTDKQQRLIIKAKIIALGEALDTMEHQEQESDLDELVNEL
jgi:hypothetical protein